ncbi:DUF3900 domain-containing protein [Ammoniphilus sp. CFH 90114]|uniref:DUF3900 domain-containing protein n=1 Tax=Ammoniphilus sp. CFH 90114 TaxID=2493665 RepID=UPI00100E8E75|nr:DUF3900 domain-containing protein [Ammoniphilus sp. CFH 90114]RXT05825.1 DUF3900 domain-containing protein [Ammoniphilus sp. CFH 90114]
MDFKVEYLSFFVVKMEGEGEQASPSYRHYQTFDENSYQESNVMWFLEGEFARTVKRKAERTPKTDQAPTKIGKFIVEPGHGLDSNPNYNMFYRLKKAESIEDFKKATDDMIRAYIQTSASRGGALIIARAKLTKYFDEPFIFIMKCDFENKIARIADDFIIQEVQMAISAKNIKSILYPYMPEEGMVNEWELKIFQSSHARYFEDFLKYVDYEPSVPELMNTQVMGMVQEFIEESFPVEQEEKEKELEEMDLWAGKKERELQEKWTPDQVEAATQALVEAKPDLEMKFKLDAVMVKSMLSEYGENIHFAKIGNRYVVLIEGDSFQFDKGISPIELLRPDQLEEVMHKITNKQFRSNGYTEVAAGRNDEDPPF